MESDDLVVVGEITAPFGMRGEVKLRTPFQDLAFLVGRTFLLRGNPTAVLGVRLHQGTALLHFEGIDRSAAELLGGTQLTLPRSELPALPEDSYYHWQLQGLQVVTESGKDLGTIELILHNPVANDVYETPVALIPAHEAFVVSVDLVDRKMVVVDDPGLLK